ncbi:toxin VasX [Aggregatibacter actinomycetemcomitans]|uniref:toxin VasX n=1 Tax=Aggregatibacter actinomycetemcomitans TaxID=714 RepID=UPI001F11FBB4|nr:toxin VasX [Aggregatibacter actinomycetemcomitans]
MEKNIKASSTPRRDLRLLKEESKKLSITNNQCALPLIPIYPLRYALSSFYLDNATKSLNKTPPQPPHIANITAPESMRRGSIHQLHQLRQGFIYIYSPTQHQYIASDKNNKWMVFRYFTHKDDVNSANQFPAGGKEAEGLGYSFILYQWGENASTYPWKIADMPSMDVVFVDKTQQWVYMAYSEYPWSAEILDQLERDEGLRNAIMSKIDVTNQNTTQNSASFDEISSFAIEFDDEEKDLFNISKNWFTRIQTAQKLPQLCGEQEKGLIVGLKDVVGELRELGNILAELNVKSEAYYKKYAYPITIGNIIDPKVAYDIRGEKYPLNANLRVIEQKGVRDALSNQFDNKYKTLMRNAYEWYEKPAQAIIGQMNDLYKWAPIRLMMTEVIPKALQATDINNYAAINHTAYVFNRLLTDMVIGLESTPEGEKLLGSLLITPEGGRDTFGNEQFRKTIKESMDAFNASITSIKDIKARQKAFDKFYRSMEQFYTFAGNSLIKTWLKGVECSVSPDKTLSNYDILTTKGEPETIFVALADRIKKSLNTELKSKTINKERNDVISHLKKQLKTEKTNWEAEFNTWSAKAEIWDKHYRFLGILAAFNGIKSLDVDLSKKKTAHTDIGRFAQDPVLQKTTAILDISIGTTDAAYGMGLIKNPGQFVPVNSQAAGGVLKAVGSNLRAVVYVGAGVIAGVLTAVIAAGGIAEAWKNGDNIALAGNIAVFVGGATGAVLTALTALDFFAGAVVLGVIGAIAFALVLIGGLVVNLWGKTPLQLWVEKGFWGNSERYFYWNNLPRDAIDTQIDNSTIVFEKELVQKIANLPKKENEIVKIPSILTDVTPIMSQYLIIIKGLENEMYEYLIQSGLQIYPTDNGQFTIFYAEFEKTNPTPANLEIYCTSYTTKKSKRITNFSYALRNVRFSLIENGITENDIALYVVFTDRENDRVRKLYESKEWKAKQNQEINEALQAKD